MSRTFDRSMVIGLILLVVLLVFDAVLDFRNTRQLNEDATRVAHADETLELMSTVLRVLVDAETNSRGYLVTGQEDYLQSYNAAIEQLNDRIAALQRETANNPLQQERTVRLKQMAAKRIALLKVSIDLRREAKVEQAQLNVASGKGKTEMEAIRGLMAEMRQAEQDLLHDRKNESKKTYRIAQTTSLLIAGFCLLMIGLFCWLLHRSLTARQQAADLIDQQREWLHTTLASIGDAVIATDVDARVTFLNSVARTLTGWSDGTAIGRSLLDVFHIVNEQSRQLVENPALRAMQEGAIVGLANHTVLISKNRQDTPIDDSAAPIRNATGGVIGSVLVFRDVSERRATEKRIYNLMIDLQEADRRKDEFLATLAHELRGPLAPLRNALEIIKHADDDRELLVNSCCTMDRQLSQMVRLVDDLLDVSRITRNRVELRKSRVELNSIFQHAVEICRPLAENCQLEITLDLPSEAIYLHADPARLIQVFGNLLNNACKYTSPGGRIWLTAVRQGSDVIVTVKDNGVGIRADMLPRIFEMFAQLDTTLERSQGGLGIGLTLVKRFVEMHGGTIEASSAGPGQGSEFAVHLPVPAELLLDAHLPDPTAIQHTASCHRILVVDDNRDSANSLATLLRLTGNETASAYDGLEALEAAKRFRPDVILLDIGLPKLNGYDVARRLRQQSGGQDITLVALTGWGQPEDRRKSADAGFDHHIVKPVDHNALMKLLAESATRTPSKTAD